MQFLAMTIYLLSLRSAVVRVLFLIPVWFGDCLWGREYLPVLARVLFLIPVSFGAYTLVDENIHPHRGGCIFSFELSLRGLGLRRCGLFVCSKSL